MNKSLITIAYIAIIVLALFTVYRTEQHAKQLAELQEYHYIDTGYVSVHSEGWISVDEVIEIRNNEITWEKIITDWYNIPEPSLRHIVQNHGLHLSIDQMVEIYNTNRDYYKAFEDSVALSKASNK